MTDEEIKTEIAAACGWKEIHVRKHIVDGWPDVLSGVEPRIGKVQAIPDYPNDLNAMHEAELTLPPEKQDDYTRNLLVVVLSDAEVEYGPIHPSKTDTMWWVCFATARERAEAFLRTVGKWKDA